MRFSIQISSDYKKWQCVICGFVGNYNSADGQEIDWVNSHTKCFPHNYRDTTIKNSISNFISRSSGSRRQWRCEICGFVGFIQYSRPEDLVYEHFKDNHTDILVLLGLIKIGK